MTKSLGEIAMAGWNAAEESGETDYGKLWQAAAEAALNYAFTCPDLMLRIAQAKERDDVIEAARAAKGEFDYILKLRTRLTLEVRWAALAALGRAVEALEEVEHD